MNEWTDLWAALALVLVIEGVMPFLNPNGFRKTMSKITEFGDQQLRTIGGVCMVVGVIVLYLVRH